MSKFIIMAVAAIATAACANTATSSSSNALEQPTIVGGWSSASVDNADVKAAAAFATKQIAAPGVTLTKIESADTQVVAGINYRMSLKLSDGRNPTVVVWKKLDGSMELLSIAEMK